MLLPRTPPNFKTQTNYSKVTLGLEDLTEVFDPRRPLEWPPDVRATPIPSPQMEAEFTLDRFPAWGFQNWFSASPKPHPSKPHPCNMPQAKTEVALQFSERCAAEVALQHSLLGSADVILTKSCAAAGEKLQWNTLTTHTPLIKRVAFHPLK